MSIGAGEELKDILQRDPSVPVIKKKKSFYALLSTLFLLFLFGFIRSVSEECLATFRE